MGPAVVGQFVTRFDIGQHRLRCAVDRVAGVKKVPLMP